MTSLIHGMIIRPNKLIFGLLGLLMTNEHKITIISLCIIKPEACTEKLKEVSRGPVPDPETQGLGVRQCRIPRHFPMNGSGFGSKFICPVSCL